jgi:hypothetical protein
MIFYTAKTRDVLQAGNNSKYFPKQISGFLPEDKKI